MRGLLEVSGDIREMNLRRSYPDHWRMVMDWEQVGSAPIIRPNKRKAFRRYRVCWRSGFAQNVILSPSAVLRIDSAKNLSHDFRPFASLRVTLKSECNAQLHIEIDTFWATPLRKHWFIFKITLNSVSPNRIEYNVEIIN